MDAAGGYNRSAHRASRGDPVMSHSPHIHRRTFLTTGALTVAGGFDPLPSVRAADPPPVPKIEPELAPKPDVSDKLRALKPNQAVLLGKADVVGEFNDTAREYDLHKTGPKGRDFTIKMCWAPDRMRALFCGANHGVPSQAAHGMCFDQTGRSAAQVVLYFHCSVPILKRLQFPP